MSGSLLRPVLPVRRRDAGGYADRVLDLTAQVLARHGQSSDQVEAIYPRAPARRRAALRPGGRRPRWGEVLLRMLDVAVRTNNVPAILAAAVPLARLMPNDPAIAMNLAIARLKTQHMALAQRAFAAFASRWPDHEQAEQARWHADKLSTYLTERWAEQSLTGPPDIDLMARNEEVQTLLSLRRYAWPSRCCAPALTSWPSAITSAWPTRTSASSTAPSPPPARCSPTTRITSTPWET
ncbi:MAG: hypothetical protein WCI67_23120 [Chloroflexales bacterium]